MNIPDKAKAFSIFEGGWDVSRAEQNYQTLVAMGEGVDVTGRLGIGQAVQPVHGDLRGAVPSSHEDAMAPRSGRSPRSRPRTTRTRCTTRYSQFRKPFTIDEVLAAPPITYPMTLPMCAPLSDGAAAAILCTEEALRRIGADRKRCIKVAASVVRSFTHRRLDQPELNIGRLAACRLTSRPESARRTWMSPKSTTPRRWARSSSRRTSGSFRSGGGGPAAERGDFTIGGRIPINPSGGLESKGHPLGATGIGQLYELVMQLRGEAGARQVQGARHAIQENGGGLQGIEEAAVAIHILSR